MRGSGTRSPCHLLVVVSLDAVLILGAFVLVPLINFVGAVEKTSSNNKTIDVVVEEEEGVLPPPTISKKITFITDHVDRQGYVDYFAALNARASENVTPENNAAVLFARAGIGPSEFESPQRELYCQMIGIDPSLADEKTFQIANVASEKMQSNLQKSMISPWSRKRFPKIAEWLDSNADALELIVEGTKRSCCYVPILPPIDANGRYGKLLEARLPVQQTCRDVARCLAARAMLNLHQKDLAATRRDLIACHRLGRLIGMTPFLISGLVGYSIDSTAYAADVSVLTHARLNSQTAKEYLTELKRLPPLPAVSDNVNFSDRLNLLDALTTMERDLSISLERPADEIDYDKVDDMRDLYDEELTVCNEHFDEFVQALQLPAYSERTKAVAVLIKKLRERLPVDYDPSNPEKTADFQQTSLEKMQGKDPDQIGRALGEIQMSLLFPDVKTPVEAEVRTRVRESMIQVGFALAAYRADHSAYPESLEALVPAFISTVPIDLFDDQSLRYLREATGYRLYSVGKDGIDDQQELKAESSTSDDLVIQIPTKRK